MRAKACMVYGIKDEIKLWDEESGCEKAAYMGIDLDDYKKLSTQQLRDVVIAEYDIRLKFGRYGCLARTTRLARTIFDYQVGWIHRRCNPVWYYGIPAT
jgi:hypothetical protein